MLFYITKDIFKLIRAYVIICGCSLVVIILCCYLRDLSLDPTNQVFVSLNLQGQKKKKKKKIVVRANPQACRWLTIEDERSLFGDSEKEIASLEAFCSHYFV